MAAPNLTLKLHIDKSSKEVRFAEASKDVVDFLFNLLLLPLGTVVRLLATEDRVGCLDKLYESVGKFTSWQSTNGQCALLEPNFPVSSTVISSLLGSSGGGPSSTSSSTGFVNSGTYYKVTDNLFVQPMPANVEAGVQDEIREVNLGLDKCRELLKAFLRAEPVLSSIFKKDIETQKEGAGTSKGTPNTKNKTRPPKTDTSGV